MAGKNSKSEEPGRSLDNQNQEAVEQLCPNCRRIFIENVTLEVPLGWCLFCRNRIRAWLRTGKDDKFMNKQIWNAFVCKSSKALDNVPEKEKPVTIVACPGDKRKQHEQQTKKALEEQNKNKAEEERASASIIKKLNEEKASRNQVREDKLRRDELLAQKLQEELNTPSTSGVAKINSAKKASPKELYIKIRPMSQKSSNSTTKHTSIGDNSDIINQECRLQSKLIDLNKNPKPGEVPLKISAKTPSTSRGPPLAMIDRAKKADPKLKELYIKITPMPQKSSNPTTKPSSSGVNSEIIDQECRFQSKPSDLNKNPKPGKVPLEISANTPSTSAGPQLANINRAKKAGPKQKELYIKIRPMSQKDSNPTTKHNSDIIDQECRFQSKPSDLNKNHNPGNVHLNVFANTPSTSRGPPLAVIDRAKKSRPKQKELYIKITRMPQKSSNPTTEPSSSGDNSDIIDQECRFQSKPSDLNMKPKPGKVPSKVSAVKNLMNGKEVVRQSKLIKDSIEKSRSKDINYQNDINRNIPKSTNASLNNNTAIDSFGKKLTKKIMKHKKPRKYSKLSNIVLADLIDSFSKTQLDDSNPKRAKNSPKKEALPEAGTSRSYNLDTDSNQQILPSPENWFSTAIIQEEINRKRQEIDKFNFAKNGQAEFDNIQVSPMTMHGTKRRQVTFNKNYAESE